MIRIGLMGFEFESSNKGCEALSYSLMPILLDCLKGQDVEILNFWKKDGLGKLPERYPNVAFRGMDIKLKKVNTWGDIIGSIRKCDFVLDITHGDSFSDIYGKRWFFHTTLLKQLVLWCGIPLILMPQTYGPFEDKRMRRWANRVVSASKRVYCRDDLSYRYLQQQHPGAVLEKTRVYTDLAFALPYTVAEHSAQEKIRVGLNISGLLWHNCETDNHLGLRGDYREYCRELLRTLVKEERYEITLIPHVICDKREGLDYYENDCRAIRLLLEEFPMCAYADDLETAIDAKSFIASQDVFIGARMHATIGAYSSGVACIPFAYSRKFAGLYNDLNYPYIVDGKTLTVREAVEKTMELVHNWKCLQEEAQKGMTIVWDKLNAFAQDFSDNVMKRG